MQNIRYVLKMKRASEEKKKVLKQPKLCFNAQKRNVSLPECDSIAATENGKNTNLILCSFNYFSCAIFGVDCKIIICVQF